MFKTIFLYSLILFSGLVLAEEKSGNDVPIKFKTLEQTKDFVFANKDEYDFEVLYFFSYACPHCYEFEPYLKLWKEKGMQENVSFSMIPVQFRDSWIESAKAYEVGKRLDILEEVNDRIFTYMHEENKSMFDKKDLLKFFTEEMGVSEKDFYKHYNAFSLKFKMKEYEQITDEFEIMGTPTLVLISKRGSTFITSPEIAESPVNMVSTIDFIVERLSGRY